MKHRENALIALIIVVIALMSCTSNIANPGDYSVTQEILIPTLTATSIQAPRMPTPCYNLQNPNSIDAEFGLGGVLGLVLPIADEQLVNEKSLVFLGGPLLQQERSLISLNGTRSIGFSPNGSWFAYQMLDTEANSLPHQTVYLMSSDGERITTPLPLIEEETNGHWFSGWISNEYMLLIYDLLDGDENISSHRFTVFNPFTGKRYQELVDNLPFWNGETAVYFSPDMTKVVYAGRNQQEESTLVLWDVEQKKILWQRVPFISDIRFDEVGIGTLGGFGKIAIWAPDSSGFVFTAVTEVEGNSAQYSSFFIERNGEREKLLINTPESYGVIYGGVWSPDQRYIAYFGSNNLLLYDFSLERLIELCLGLPPYINEVLWSPDSNYLAFMADVNDKLHLAVLSVYSGEVVAIREIRNFFPTVWLWDEAWLNVSDEE